MRVRSLRDYDSKHYIKAMTSERQCWLPVRGKVLGAIMIMGEKNVSKQVTCGYSTI